MVGDPSPKIPVISSEEKIELQQNKINNIEEWYQNNKPLGYSADLRKQLRTFVFNAINWQAEGIPAYLAKIKMDDNNFIYIHNQVQQTDKSKAFVKLERTAGNRDILLALCKYDYSKSWDFDNGVFFQLKLVNWLERNKNFIKKSVCGYENTEDEYPTFKWSIADGVFASNCLIGNTPNITDEKIDKELFEPQFISKNLYPEPEKNDDWLKVVRKVENDEDKFKTELRYMQGYANTFMGVVGDEQGGDVKFYKGELVLSAIKKLKEQNWWLYDELPDETTTSLLGLSALLKGFISKNHKMIESEKQNVQKALDELSRLLGGEILLICFWIRPMQLEIYLALLVLVIWIQN